MNFSGEVGGSLHGTHRDFAGEVPRKIIGNA